MSSKGKGCKKVKDPCKICLQKVTAKTGLSCKGACEAWVHYECLNYTPGKIADIKKGLITVTCPCPDCKTTVPKEFITNEPYSCNNVQCPANNPPSCEIPDCQANELARNMPPRCPPPGTLRQCADSICRDFSGPNAYQSSLDDSCMQGFMLKTFCGDSNSKDKYRVMLPPPPDGNPKMCGVQQHPVQQFPGVAALQQGLQQNMQQQGIQQGSPQIRNVVPQGTQVQGGNNMNEDMMAQMCKAIGTLAEQMNFMYQNMKGMAGPNGNVSPGPSCGKQGSECEGTGGCKRCAEMQAMKAQQNQCTGGCGKAGDVKCTTPCYCPGNPVQKR